MLFLTLLLPITVIISILIYYLFIVVGDSFSSLQYLFRVGRTTIGEIVSETGQAIIKALETDYLKVITT